MSVCLIYSYLFNLTEEYLPLYAFTMVIAPPKFDVMQLWNNRQQQTCLPWVVKISRHYGMAMVLSIYDLAVYQVLSSPMSSVSPQTIGRTSCPQQVHCPLVFFLCHLSFFLSSLSSLLCHLPCLFVISPLSSVLCHLSSLLYLHLNSS